MLPFQGLVQAAPHSLKLQGCTQAVHIFMECCRSCITTQLDCPVMSCLCPWKCLLLQHCIV